MNIRTGVSAAVLTAVVGLSVLAPAAVSAGNERGGRGFNFEPLPTSTECVAGGAQGPLLTLPAGFTSTMLAQEPQFPDAPDVNTLNETGPQAGRFLYRVHRTETNGALSVTDLRTGETRIVAQREDWEDLDGIVWTPWKTILIAEEAEEAALPDPDFPNATGGLIYEIDPQTGEATALPALGSRKHEGIHFDHEGNLYGVSAEQNPGYIYKFTPDRRGDLSSGQLFALQITQPNGQGTGQGVWVPLDREAVKIDSDATAAAAGATGYDGPEDIETATSTGRDGSRGRIVYVAINGENRIIAIDLRGRGDSVNVYDYVKSGVNAPSDFTDPDSIALDRAGNLYISEDTDGGAVIGDKRFGDDIWVAAPNGLGNAAANTVRFASETECEDEVTGVYFNKRGNTLFVSIQRGDRPDQSLAITRTERSYTWNSEETEIE
jgi:hypothetical protein